MIAKKGKKQAKKKRKNKELFIPLVKNKVFLVNYDDYFPKIIMVNFVVYNQSKDLYLK